MISNIFAGGALETRPFLLVFSSNSDLNRWLEAIQNVGVQSDVVCNMISPSSPSKYDTVQVCGGHLIREKIHLFNN